MAGSSNGRTPGSEPGNVGSIPSPASIMYITDAHGDINFAKGVVFQAETTMATFLPEIGTFFTQAITWMGDVLDVVVENPALLVLVIAMPVCGFAVGLLNRLIRM